MPYAAVTRFYDPSVQFLLQFEAGEGADEAAADGEVVQMRPRSAPALVQDAPEADTDGTSPDEAPPTDGGPDGNEPDDDGPKIVSLDKFRKK